MLYQLNLNFFIFFSLTSFFLTFLITKYSKHLFFGSLLDKDFLKPQAFHKKPIARIGGFVILLLLILFIILFLFIFNTFLIDYLTISLLLFALGFVDDLKIKINPNIRLALVLILLVFCRRGM